MKAKFLRAILILLLLGLNIGCDQLSKSIVRHKMNYNTYVTFLHNHITLTKVENTGAFLSVGNSLTGPLRIILLNVIPLLAIAAGLGFILFNTSLDWVTTLALVLILGGGFGNIYDRVVHGSVTDFIYMNFVIFQTGIFNIADVSITTGTFFLLIYSWVKKPDVVENKG